MAQLLSAASPSMNVELVPIATVGDQRPDMPLTSAGEGIFVKQLEEALQAGAIDLAVHSLKDLPTVTPSGLALAAVLARHDPRDALVSHQATKIEDLPENALVATGSPRRRCQLLHLRPDLRFTAIRGNVDTRLAKLEAGGFDAMVLAVAGIERLGRTDAPYTPIPTSACLPAPGQGALAIEVRAGDEGTARLVRPLNDAASASCVAAERSFLHTLGAGCLAPAGALATMSQGRLTIEGLVGSPDGRTATREQSDGEAKDAVVLGAALARRLAARDGA